MSTLSQNEIQERAYIFAAKWLHFNDKEIAGSQTFWDELFMVYGKMRSELARFEHSVKKESGHGRIDVFWPGQLLVEQKGPAVALDNKVTEQALAYVQALPEHEKPKHVVLCNFKEFIIFDLKKDQQYQFSLQELPKYTHIFNFIAGYSEIITYQEEEMSLQAAELLAKLYSTIEAGDNKPSIELNYFMVQLLYCFFADHTGLFAHNIAKHPFHHYIETYSNPDGFDLHSHIIDMFQVLNTPIAQRDHRLNNDLKALPYVNGDLFSDTSYRLYGNAEIRATLLEVAKFNWSEISPAIFGTLFQMITNPSTREVRGEHYTSEPNIQKAIGPLFMDALHKEFDTIKDNKQQLDNFINKLATIMVLDPACGSGNFLVVAYRELRKLELKALLYLHKDKVERHLLQESVPASIKVNVHQFYGIEIEQLPSKIAQLALWLTDHQMNMEASLAFGIGYTRLPLTASATIWNTNALTCNWNELIAAEKLHYIVGNPPFLGSAWQTTEQKQDKVQVFANWKGIKKLDYVACWYKKSADMMQLNPQIKAALVSTNSITQGEQLFPLWHPLTTNYGVHIHFAHRTFKWFNEASKSDPDRANVHCVIIGFALLATPQKFLWDYTLSTDETGEKVEHATMRSSEQAINPDLTFFTDNILIKKRTIPLDINMPRMRRGSDPHDGGNLLLSPAEKDALLAAEPKAAPYIKQIMGAYEFLNNKERYCLWLVDANPMDLMQMPEVQKRIQAVKKHRSNNSNSQVRKAADKASQFLSIRQPTSNYIFVPKTSSEGRVYSPMGFNIDKNILLTDLAFSLENATPYLFGVLSSRLHQVWLTNAGGRLKSDLRYSNTLVYNTFPFPHQPTQAQQDKVAALATQMLEIRQKYLDQGQGMTLAKLYNKDNFMLFHDLIKVHRELDKAVERCYRKEPFDNDSDTDRIAYLFSQYKYYTDTLFNT